MAEADELYEQDFLRWTEKQAAALRRAKGSNLPLDWENLAEEIESLGKSERKGLRSQIRRILRPLFKLTASPASAPRPGWEESIRDARAEIDDILRDSPSLRREIAGLVSEQAPIAAKFAAADLTGYDKAAGAVRARLEKGGFTAEEVLGDWFPDPPRKLE
ncbi:MAG TPA: DUF29 domain-containing protein [Stellaceae bacterium]|nr:DUF29 domain-containing protein [Stellaceae bacterium]